MDGVRVVRYRYAPSRWQTLVNDGGMATNLKRQRWKWLLVPGFFISMLWTLWREVRTSRPDVIHVHWIIPQGFIVACLASLVRLPPFLVTSHGADIYTFRAPLLLAAKRWVVKRAAKLTVVSEPMRRELLAIGADATRISVQSMGVDFEQRFVLGNGAERSSDEILFVGRLVEKKGLRHLLEAMPAILKAHPGASLTVAGFGPELQASRDLAEQLGVTAKVRFLGAVSQAELPSLYRRAAVFVAPFVEARSGDREGLGLVALEAAACGCPVVVSKLPAVVDAFEGLPVQWVEPGNANALALAVSHSLNDAGSREAAMKVRAGLIDRFEWSAVARAYGRLLLDLVKSASR
jgi:glycosyltransferase involved in cell wall biosynthesis